MWTGVVKLILKWSSKYVCLIWVLALLGWGQHDGCCIDILLLLYVNWVPFRCNSWTRETSTESWDGFLLVCSFKKFVLSIYMIKAFYILFNLTVLMQRATLYINTHFIWKVKNPYLQMVVDLGVGVPCVIYFIPWLIHILLLLLDTEKVLGTWILD